MIQWEEPRSHCCWYKPTIARAKPTMNVANARPKLPPLIKPCASPITQRESTAIIPRSMWTGIRFTALPVQNRIPKIIAASTAMRRTHTAIVITFIVPPRLLILFVFYNNFANGPSLPFLLHKKTTNPGPTSTLTCRCKPVVFPNVPAHGQHELSMAPGQGRYTQRLAGEWVHLLGHNPAGEGVLKRPLQER